MTTAIWQSDKISYSYLIILSPSLPARSYRAVVHDNVVEDNARAGIFFHRSTDYAEAYNNVCRRNLEGDFGIVESTGVKVYDNVMEVSEQLSKPIQVDISCTARAGEETAQM